MDTEMAPPAYTPSEGQSATFAEVATKIKELSGEQRLDQFHEALMAFKAFLISEEQTKLSK